MTKLFEGAVKKVNNGESLANSIIPDQYDIGYSDMSSLLEMIRNGKAVEAVTLAFDFGFVMGNRCTLRRKLRRL